MLIESGSKLVMIGDSITDQERGRPIGEGLWGAIGKGYVGYVEGILEVTYPQRRIRVVNMGCSGDTTRDLRKRWESDVLALKPDWLSILIGINDVWRQFDTPLITENHVYLDEYVENLEYLVRTTRPQLKGLVIMTPYYMELNKKDPMRVMMDRYGQAAKEIAKKYDAITVDLQTTFDALGSHIHPCRIAWDMIHPNIAGNMVIARAFLQAVEYAWDGQ